jgi:hypothetical protein
MKFQKFTLCFQKVTTKSQFCEFRGYCKPVQYQVLSTETNVYFIKNDFPRMRSGTVASEHLGLLLCAHFIIASISGILEIILISGFCSRSRSSIAIVDCNVWTWSATESWIYLELSRLAAVNLRFRYAILPCSRLSITRQCCIIETEITSSKSGEFQVDVCLIRNLRHRTGVHLRFCNFQHVADRTHINIQWVQYS